MKDAIISTYMRGFRAAVAGFELADGVAAGSYAAGYRTGTAVLVIAVRGAEKYAEYVLASPAMIQAGKNGKVEP